MNFISEYNLANSNKTFYKFNISTKKNYFMSESEYSGKFEIDLKFQTKHFFQFPKIFDVDKKFINFKKITA